MRSVAKRGRWAVVFPPLALWIGASTVMSFVAGAAHDWFDMTDEMRYERLAITIAQTHSLDPAIHGVHVSNYSQLYPLLIAPVFARGHLPHDVITAHVVNAWIMTSACIPAYLLARSVTARRGAAVAVATLSIAIPWMLYTTMLMTEVAAYPAFMWALFAAQRSLVRPSWRSDLLALGALPLAYEARTPLLVVVVILPLALVAFEVGQARGDKGRHMRLVFRQHAVLVSGYAALLIGALVLRITGNLSVVFGLYGYYANNQSLFGAGFPGALVAHLATLSIGIGVLPFIVGLGWLFANVVRPAASRELHAFACLAAASVIVIVLQATSFDLRYVNYVHDRFLFYLAPLLLTGAVCALQDVRRTRWSMLVPSALVVAGFVFGPIQRGAIQAGVPLDPDDPAAALYKPFADLAGSLPGARILLACATVGLALAFVVGATRVSRRIWSGAMVVFLATGTIATTGYVFDRFFGIPGYSDRPLTVDLSGADWVDRAVGSHASVTKVPYPVSSDYRVMQKTWQDLEFWNKAVDREVHYPHPGVFEGSGIWFPKVYIRFDSATGATSDTLSRYVLEADQEARFRIRGPVIADKDGVMLIDAVRPWSVDWLSSGAYLDGWTRPHVPVRVRLFPAEGQRRPRVRYLTLGFRAPGGVAARPVDVVSDLDHWRGRVTQDTTHVQIRVCLPPRGSTVVGITTRQSSLIPPDMSNDQTLAQAGRQGGIFLSEIALADEVGGRCSVRDG